MRRAHDFAGASQFVLLGIEFGQAKVRDQRSVGASVDEDVLWLQVAMKDSLLMSFIHSSGDGLQVGGCHAIVEWPIAQQFGQAEAVDISHREEMLTVCFTNVVDLLAVATCLLLTIATCGFTLLIRFAPLDFFGDEFESMGPSDSESTANSQQ